MEVTTVLIFNSPKEFNLWLEQNSQITYSIWIRFFKKSVKKPHLNYQEALEEALCYGWIDGIRKSYDGESFVQRFTPRRKKSLWSKRNTLIVDRLITEERMKDQGLKEVELAKADGRWEKAYSSKKSD